MPRRRRAEVREIQPDSVYGSTLAEKFINSMMWEGKKTASQNIFYGAMTTIQERTNDEPLKLFKKAVENCKPLLEVKTRRVGGANYQVPIEVPQNRRTSLAIRWILAGSRARSEKSMAERPIRHSRITGGSSRENERGRSRLTRLHATYDCTREHAEYRHHGPHRCR